MRMKGVSVGQVVRSLVPINYDGAGDDQDDYDMVMLTMMMTEMVMLIMMMMMSMKGGSVTPEVGQVGRGLVS